MSEVQLDVIVRRVSATPASYIGRARHQTRAGLGALSELSAVWTEVPDTMELGVIDLFLSHLRGEMVPSLEVPPLQGQLAPEFAHQSLLGLTEMDRRIDDPQYNQQSDAILAAWPGIFKWAHYLLKRYLASREKERNGLPKFHSVFRFLNLSAQSQKLIVPMVDTPGCVELVTECWMVEDVPRSGAAESDGLISLATTMTTHALAILLKQSAARGVAHANALDTEHVQTAAIIGIRCKSISTAAVVSCFTTTMSPRSYTSSPALIDYNNLPLLLTPRTPCLSLVLFH
ncbi:hypothetical protein FB45DRAFT_57158 [Roridomyces roridus]|uniref:Uncharacterized protein n=1 Tax=Roridomyces roridus TaxID=1738132 RepID=A0AAD7BPU5_9AGAR|nr:hypothetical protein FB45DRAFT_57158 [Roridomyces roridus]